MTNHRNPTFKPGDRIESTETGALGTYLGNGQTRFDACHINGTYWPEKIVYWSTTRMRHATTPADTGPPTNKQ